MRSSSRPSARIHDCRDSQHSSSGSKSSFVVSPLFSLTSPMVSKVALSSTGSSMSIAFLSCVDYPDLPSVSWIVIELATSVVSDGSTTANCLMELWESSSLSLIDSEVCFMFA
ncbi:hypothetical protein VitviT2T_024549 [Vitis vinifera]|uniref:Uncharacterized protein n=1 Tax=Vitis vinifera TaxID=29760 RepID=A0ABY9DIG8_VITVI|nr:hypothetical protein VitviT2T_024549 [Vitis vinifera]